MVDWTKLPYDLISIIADRIAAIESFLAFSAVCHSWRFVYLQQSWSPPPNFPWLMLSEGREEKEEEGGGGGGGNSKRAFFSFQKKKCHLFPLPQAQGRRCWGSSSGWLFTIGLDLQIHLLNPITQARINLPPQSTFTHQPTFVSADNRAWFRAHSIHKAFVFRLPSDRFLVMAIHGLMNDHLAFATPGHDSWVTVETPRPFVYEDVAEFNGQIFAICGAGTLVLVEIEGPGSPTAKPIAPPPDRAREWQKLYLVESAGELLLVHRILGRSNDFSFATICFEIYKFDFVSNKWVRKDELGNQSLFVGDNNSFAVSCCGDVEGCKANSIYFADDTAERRPGSHGGGKWDMGVYNMANRSVKSLEFGVDFSLDCGEKFTLNYSVPLWMIPSLS